MYVCINLCVLHYISLHLIRWIGLNKQHCHYYHKLAFWLATMGGRLGGWVGGYSGVEYKYKRGSSSFDISLSGIFG